MYLPIQFRQRRCLFTPPGHIWDDEFTIARSAGSVGVPLTDPKGDTRSVADANSVIGISGSLLVINGNLAQQNGYLTALLARVAGRMFVWNVPTRTTTTNFRYGAA